MSVIANYGGDSHIVFDRGAAMGKCAASALCAISVGLSAAMFWPGNGTAILPAFAQSSAQRSLASADRSIPQTEAVEVIVKDYLNTHPEEIKRVVKDFILAHPEVLREAITALMKARMPPNADKSAEVRSNAAALFNSAHQVTLGNPNGDVTLVEFFDYNCGYCKRALGDMLELMKSDPKLRVVLKEFPVLGRGSVEAAQVAVAVRMQDGGGARYLEFHRKLLESRGVSDKASALAAAAGVGFDPARLELDIASEEVRATIEESTKLARALSIDGTPSYVIGENVVVGAVGIAALKSRVQSTRQ